MNNPALSRCCLLSMLLVAPVLAAETAYITDQIQVGLHQDQTLDSPIVVVLPSGTAVEVVKQEDNLSYVQGPDGNAGWIDNSYLKAAKPAEGAALRNLELELAQANQRLREQQGGATGSSGAEYQQLQRDHEALQQEYNKEKLRAGELQVQLAELRKRIGQDNDTESLYARITQLEEQNKNLEVQLAGVLEQGGVDPGALRSIPVDDLLAGWRRKLIYFAIALVLGLCLGIYCMDYLNRRRHGGFRI